MKTLFNTTVSEFDSRYGFSNFDYHTVNQIRTKKYQQYLPNYNDLKTKFIRENLLTPKAMLQMEKRQIPDLWNVCQELVNTFFLNQPPYSALQFVSVLKKFAVTNKDEIQRFLKNPEHRHVLIENDLLKVVLIHWKPGKISNIHGHPKGGCVFKILQGKLEELRYSTDSSQKIISSCGYTAGSIAYIDDNLGYHAVGNPFGSSAISLHVYTSGKE